MFRHRFDLTDVFAVLVIAAAALLFGCATPRAPECPATPADVIEAGKRGHALGYREGIRDKSGSL